MPAIQIFERCPGNELRGSVTHPVINVRPPDRHNSRVAVLEIFDEVYIGGGGGGTLCPLVVIGLLSSTKGWGSKRPLGEIGLRTSSVRLSFVSDVNECATSGHVCVSPKIGGHCVNTIGSYRCECRNATFKYGNGVVFGKNLNGKAGSSCRGMSMAKTVKN